MRATLFAALVLAFSACTVTATDDPMMGDDGSDGTDTPTPDPGSDPQPDPDPDPDPDPGAEPSTCPPMNMGSIDTLKDESATIDWSDPDDPDSPAVRWLDGLIDPDSALQIGLWDGFGAFAEFPPEPGDYGINGDDDTPEACGLCFEVTVSKGDVVHRMFATGGTLSLTSVDDNLTGSASTVSLEEFDESGALVEGGCRALIEHLAFDAPLEPLFPRR
jgi:hypothetical protein